VQKVFAIWLDDVVAHGGEVLDVFWNRKESGVILEEMLRQRFENISTGELIECEERQKLCLKTMQMYEGFLEEEVGERSAKIATDGCIYYQTNPLHSLRTFFARPRRR
tara:strand:+ start:1371 stop:1694 length:324 start_codon:yes stop_codon:yes gene_type:complete